MLLKINTFVFVVVSTILSPRYSFALDHRCRFFLFPDQHFPFLFRFHLALFSILHFEPLFYCIIQFGAFPALLFQLLIFHISQKFFAALFLSILDFWSDLEMILAWMKCPLPLQSQALVFLKDLRSLTDFQVKSSKVFAILQIFRHAVS